MENSVQAIHSQYHNLMWKCIHEAGLSKDKSAEAVGYLAVEAAAKKMDFSKSDGERFVYMRRTIAGYLKNYKADEYVKKGFVGWNINPVIISGDSVLKDKDGFESNETVFSTMEDYDFAEAEENDSQYRQIQKLIKEVENKDYKKFFVLGIKYKFNKTKIAENWYTIGEVPESAVVRHGSVEKAKEVGISSQYLDRILKKNPLFEKYLKEFA